MISTVDDMHTFIEALVAGELFQQPETLSEMMNTIQTSHPALAGYGLGLEFWDLADEKAAHDKALEEELRQRIADRPDIAERVLKPSDAKDLAVPQR